MMKKNDTPPTSVGGILSSISAEWKSAEAPLSGAKEDDKIAIFEGQKIRRIWDKKQEKWYFSVIDIISVLTEQTDFKKSQSYWTTLKNRLKKEGSESVTKCDKLKLQSTDGLLERPQSKRTKRIRDPYEYYSSRVV